MIFKRRSKLSKNQILAYYQSGKVATARGSASFQQAVLHDFYELLTQNYPTGKWHILEFGVGHGWNLPQQVKYFGKITAVDVAPVAISESSQYGFKNVDLKLISGQELPFKNDSFDLVIACEVLEHVADLHKTSTELKRIIKPGGFILVSVPVYLNLRGISKKIMEAILGEGTWEPARSHPGGYERFLTPGKIRSYFESSRNKHSSFKEFKVWHVQGADYGTAWSLPMIPLYPQKFAPFFEVTLGKFPPLKNFGMNYYFLAQKA